MILMIKHITNEVSEKDAVRNKLKLFEFYFIPKDEYKIIWTSFGSLFSVYRIFS